jgi:hypothetical protein
MVATMKPEVISVYKVQMIRGLMENGLNTVEAIKAGCVKARTQGGQYPPSVPEFIKWCKPEQKELSHQLLPRLDKQDATPEQIKALSDELREAMKGI